MQSFMQCNTLCRALAVIDHIVSTTAYVVPVKRVAEVLRQVGAVGGVGCWGWWWGGCLEVVVWAVVMVRDYDDYCRDDDGFAVRC